MAMFSSWKSLKPVRCAVTVEPMLFFYFLSAMLSTTIGSNLLLHKGCDPNATAAPDLTISPGCLMETNAQHIVSTVNVWKNLIQELLSLVFIIFAGPWSDNHGRRRRPLMFVPLFGQILCDTLNVVFSVFWQVSPIITGITQSVIVSTTGSFHCFLIGVFAYLADVTDETNRTMRIGFATSIMPLSATVAAVSAGYLNVMIGFTGVFVLTIGINVIALCLGLLFVYDTSVPYKSTGSIYRSTFNPEIVIKSFKTVVVKRDNHKTIILILIIIATPLTGAPFIGEITLMYMYLRKQFGFREIDFSLFHAYTMVIVLLGSLFTLGILSRLLRMNDALIGLIATFFDIATAVGFLLVTQIEYLFFVPPLEVFRGAALSLVGAIASKCVEPQELGSMNSVRMVLENLSKSAIIPLYNIVYNRTLETMPNAFFIITICLTIPLLGIFGTIYYYNRDQVTAVQENDNAEGTSPKDGNSYSHNIEMKINSGI